MREFFTIAIFKIKADIRMNKTLSLIHILAIQRNLMRLQHCSGLAAGKIDPEHLRVVLKIVDIAALFLRAVQHQM